MLKAPRDVTFDDSPPGCILFVFFCSFKKINQWRQTNSDPLTNTEIMASMDKDLAAARSKAAVVFVLNH